LTCARFSSRLFLCNTVVKATLLAKVENSHLSGEAAITISKRIHLIVKCIPSAYERLIFMRVGIKHKRRNPQFNRVLNKRIYVIFGF
jgi:hypothetical protein